MIVFDSTNLKIITIQSIVVYIRLVVTCCIVSKLDVTGFPLNLRRPVGAISFGRNRPGEKQTAAAFFSFGHRYP